MRIILVLLGLVIAKSISAQIRIDRFTATDVDRLKSTKTLFVCGDDDDVEMIQEELDKVWDITTLEVIPFSEYMDKEDLYGYSVFSIVLKNNGSLDYPELDGWRFVLGTQERNKRGEIRSKDVFAYVPLRIAPSAFGQGPIGQGYHQKEWFYDKGVWYNMNLGYAKLYVSILNNLLKDEVKGGRIYNKREVHKNLSQLMTDTLYISENILLKRSGIGDKRTEEEVLGDYPYPYKMMDEEAFEDMLLYSDEPKFILTCFGHVAFDIKMIRVYQTQTGKIMYSNWKKFSIVYNPKDTNRLVKAIGKSKKKKK